MGVLMVWGTINTICGLLLMLGLLVKAAIVYLPKLFKWLSVKIKNAYQHEN